MRFPRIGAPPPTSSTSAGGSGPAGVAFTDEGVAAEPCAADAARRWFLADGTTQLGEEAYVIVANPFAVAAVMDVVLYTSDGPRSGIPIGPIS